MAFDLYADSDATGANNGSSWTDAFASLQDLYDNVSDGDVCGARGTFSGDVQVDTLEASIGTKVQVVGCNSSGDEDSTTPFTISGGTNGLYITKRNYTLKHAIITGASGAGISGSYAAGVAGCNWNLFNVALVGNYDGIDVSALSYIIAHRCDFNENTRYGLVGNGNITLLRSRITHNGSHGMELLSYLVSRGCLYHGNAGDNIRLNGGILEYNTIDGADDDGVYYNASSAPLISRFNRITNNGGYAFNTNLSVMSVADYLWGNAGGDINVATALLKDYLTRVAADNVCDGYKNRAAHDFRVTPGAVGTNIPMPMGDIKELTNVGFYTAGCLMPERV